MVPVGAGSIETLMEVTGSLAIHGTCSYDRIYLHPEDSYLVLSSSISNFRNRQVLAVSFITVESKSIVSSHTAHIDNLIPVILD